MILGLYLLILLLIYLETIRKDIEKENYSIGLNSLNLHGLECFILGQIFCLLYFYGYNLEYYVYILFISILFFLSLIDYRYKKVPKNFSLFLIVLALIKSVYLGRFLINFKISVVFIFISFLLYHLSGHGFGIGDIKIYLGLSYYFTPHRFLLTIFLSLFFASLYSIIKLLEEELKLGDKLAFVPFIFLAFIVSEIYGDRIIKLYINFIGR